MSDPKFVKAVNLLDDSVQSVPRQYVEKGLFGGVFVTPEEAARRKKSRSRGRTAVDTPAADEAAPPTETDPAAGASTTTKE